VHHPLAELATIADLDNALAASAFRPILIFKHSATCGTSAMAHEEVDDLLAGSTPPVDLFMVRIQGARDVSRAITDRLGIRHESPQVLLVSAGRVLWHASHFRVTARSIAAALAQHVPEPQLSR